MSDNREVVSVDRVINATPDAIFALLADPRRHRDFDGSGTVGEAKDLPDRLRLGSKFGMSMKQGVSYSMVNEVVEFEEGRRIAWKPHMKAFAWVSGGRVWRYELEPVDGGTRVTDRIEFEPRVPLVGGALRALFTAVFRHRHARLGAHFRRGG